MDSSDSVHVAPTSSSNILQQLESLNPSSQEFTKVLQSILLQRRYVAFAEKLGSHDAQRFINILDKTSNSIPGSHELYSPVLRALQNLCFHMTLVPSSCMLSDGLVKTAELPATLGGFADVWNGAYRDKTVAIKALRIYNPNDLLAIKKLLFKEVVSWKRLSHPNVLSFLGVSTDMFKLCMVSEWMPQGNISNYVATHPDADRTSLLKDVGKGLQYLHKCQIVHGDLKGPNILINNELRACISDFGMTHITNDPHSINSLTSGPIHGSARWMAPEVLNPDHPEFEVNRPREASDIYSYSMIIIEVYAGNAPFAEYHDDMVIFKVIAGMRPSRPMYSLKLGLTDDLWSLVQRSWVHDPGQRPHLSEILSCLRDSQRRQ